MRAALYLGTILATLWAGAAQAESDPVEIVVSAPGGAIDSDETLAVPAEALHGATRADLLAALQRALPGVTLADPQGNAWSAGLTWRGYSLSSLQGTEQGLAVYLDGVRFNQPFGDTLLLDLVPEDALASAELRDSSPVYGRNALGGVLLLRSATGRDRPGVNARGWVDSIGGAGTSASLGLAGERDALLVSVEGINDPGWRRFSPSRLARGAAAFDHTGGDWGIGLRASGATTRLTGNAVAPVELLDADYRAIFTHPDTSRTSGARLAVLPWLTLGDTSRIEATLHGNWLTRRTASGDLADIEACDDAPGILCVESEGVDGEEEAEVLFGPDGGTLPADPDTQTWAVVNRGEERTTSGGIGLQFLDERRTERGERRLAVGFAYERATTRFRGATELGELEVDRSVSSEGVVLSSSGEAITPVDLSTQLSDLALYASAEVPLPGGFTVEASLRWSRNSVELRDRIGTALNGKHRFDRLNPSIELDWRPAGADWSLHAGYAETSRAPTPAELSCADPDRPCALGAFFIADPPLDQVVARRWSVGASGGESLRWHAELWRSDSDNAIRQVAAGVRGRAYFANGGPIRRQGMEAGFEWRQGPWRLAAGYALTDARVREGFTALSPNNPEADDDGTVMVEVGDVLPGTPRHSGNLALGWEQHGWTIDAALRAQSGQFLIGDEGNGNAPLPGFAVVDLALRRELGRHVVLGIEARNLFDRRYATFATFSETDTIVLAEAPGASDPRAYAPAAPRRVTVSLQARF
ncbi:outer membrane receptor protein involved in Fe transport [Novosphingobium kunmingense]|uniref:Outer membrane receptor protein involved in Fe transport n=1 Tax=Novosphingobium kunmingense TaxID=1211806 RepID=A0A2N0H6B8_9SPHN|nr:TonB-dependent receptor [Novosphingobium kunmingense]PKB14493.1 outer membrane receptor protein involved in Fe transport [Novosphingobium kunmingense]